MRDGLSTILTETNRQERNCSHRNQKGRFLKRTGRTHRGKEESEQESMRYGSWSLPAGSAEKEPVLFGLAVFCGGFSLANYAGNFP